MMFGAVGGAVGVVFGTAVTYGLAHQRGWQPLVPEAAVGAGLAAAAVIGALAGLYPRAAGRRALPHRSPPNRIWPR
jgi:putative ABC transport system permease protein